MISHVSSLHFVNAILCWVARWWDIKFRTHPFLLSSSLPFLFLPIMPLLSSFPLSLHSLPIPNPFPPLPLPSLPLDPSKWSGERYSSPSGSEWSQAAKCIWCNSQLKICKSVTVLPACTKGPCKIQNLCFFTIVTIRNSCN